MEKFKWLLFRLLETYNRISARYTARALPGGYATFLLRFDPKLVVRVGLVGMLSSMRFD